MAPSGGLTAKSDGTSCIASREGMVVYGGAVAHKVWILNLRTNDWRETVCQGDVPPPRLYHSAVCYGETMLVYGGELTDTSAADATPYYELDLQTFVWRAVPTHGESPGHRSHHTASMVDGQMYVIGGRSTANGRACQHTVSAVRDDVSRGFFNLYILDVTSRAWRCVQRVDPVQPMVWGHSTCVFRHFLIVYGGFDVSGQGEDESPDAPPSATLSASVYSYDTASYTWRVLTPKAGVVQPPPRAMHVALTCMSEMFVFGGMSVDPTTGEAAILNDAWTWDVASGIWAPVREFCIPSFESMRLLAVVHDSHLAVCGGVGSVHLLDLQSKSAGWMEYPCDARALAKKQPPPQQQHQQQQQPPPRLPPAPAHDTPHPPPFFGDGLLPGSPARPAGAEALPPDLPTRVASVDRLQGVAGVPPEPPGGGGASQLAQLHQQLQSLQTQVSQVTADQRRSYVADAAAGGAYGSSASPVAPPQAVPAALGPPADPSAEVAMLQDELRRLQEQQALQQDALQQHRRTDVLGEIQRRRAAQELQQLQQEEQRRQQLQAMQHLAALPGLQHAQQQQQPQQRTAEPTPADPAPYSFSGTPPTVPAAPRPHLSLEDVSAVLAPWSRHPQPHQASTSGAPQSGEAKLQRYRRSKERRASAGGESGGGGGGGGDRQVEHENRRLQHLHRLQEQLREIESKVGDEEVAEEALRLEAVQRAASRSPPSPVAGHPEALQQQQYEMQQMQMNMLQMQQQQAQLEQLRQQQQMQMQQAQQRGPSTAGTASPPHVMQNRNISPLPTDPAEWNMLRELLGDEYEQIDSGNFPIGRLGRLPPGAPMLECVQECTEGVLYGSGKGAPHTHRWITMIILAATTVTGFLGILSDLLSPQESRNLYSLAACTALVAINTALLLYLLGGGDVTTPIQAAVLLLPAAVTTLINVSGTSAMGGHLWPIYILIINCAMLFRLDEKYISAGVAAVVLWSTLVFAETALRFGLFDLPGGMSQHDRRQIVEEMMNCDGPLPCPRRTELVLVDWALMCLVFLGGYLVTRTFASQLYREKSATQATINTIRMIAERLSDYDLDTVHDILLANEGDLPQELADALRKLENNLRLYQPYLPHAMSQMHPDEEGEGAFSDVMVSPPGVVPEDVTVVFTDIRASTAIWEAAPDAMKRAMCIHNDLIRVATADCEGYEVKTIGDAFMVAFESTVYGVNFGLRVHTLLMGAAWPSSLLQIPLCAKTQHWSGLTTRIGVNSGPVSAEKNTLTGRMDYFGHTVNVASRLEQVCLPGAVAIPAELWSEVSGICAPAVAGSIQAVPLKGVKEPVRMVCLWPTALQGRRQNPLPAPQQALGEKGVGGGLPRLDSAYATVGTAQFLFSGNVARRMNDGLQSLIACLERSNGTIVTVLGSAVAVGWNIARRTEAHAETSLRFARLLESAFSGNAVALGLASGTVQHGPVGTTSHRYLTVVGRSVRVSYSLCKLAERHRRCCLFSAPEELDGLLPASLRAYLRSFSGHCSGEEQLPSAIFELVVEDGGAGKGKEPCV